MVLNSIYLSVSNLSSARSVFLKEKPRNIRLENIFNDEIFELLLAKLVQASYKEKFDPEKNFYELSRVKEIDSFLKGPFFRVLVERVLGIKEFSIVFEVRKLSQGCYTLLHDDLEKSGCIDFIIDFSDASSFGGHTTYLSKDRELLTIIPKANSISFVARDRGVMKFTKYVQRSQGPIYQVVGSVMTRRGAGSNS